jgi:hypothetical protein
MIEVIFASLDLLHDAMIRSLPHPLRAPWRYSIRTVIIGPELLMKPRQAMMGAIHESSTLHRVAKAVAVTASEEPASMIEFCNLSAAIHAIGANVADKPGTLAAEAAGGPADRHALVDGLPFLIASSDTVMKGDRCSFTDDLDGRDYVAAVRPLPGTELPTGKKPGARQLHHTERSAAFHRPAALPVVATTRHVGFLCLNLLPNRDRRRRELDAGGGNDILLDQCR